MKSQQIIAATKQDCWSLVMGKHDDDLRFGYREGFCDVVDFTGYSRVLIITWAFNHEGDSGIPSQDETSEMEDFENKLVESLEHDFHAMLTAVITERGTRQWIFYISELSECERRINGIPQKAERYPIELVVETNADWSYLRNKIKTIFDSAA
jgi:hypothetical protein